MSIPRIAIVGRPNVGKSSLMNRLARRRVSIVDPTSGVTRDRVSTMIELEPPLETPKGTPARMVEVIDTGGYGVYAAEGGRYDDVGADLATLTPGIEMQIGLARKTSDLILFIVDAQTGLTPLDETIARMLRAEGSAAKIMLIANKVDSESWEPHAMEAAGLGLGEPHAVSAENGFGMRRLLDAIYQRLDAMVPPNHEMEAGKVDPHGKTSGEFDPHRKTSGGGGLSVAIVGKRNSGKSTLINALAGSPRVIVSEIAGTTRDSVDVQLDFEGRTMTAIDTAGLRRRKSFADDIEYYAYHRMLGAIRRADVVMLMVDATSEVSQVDQKLAQELLRQFKPTIIVVNKIDKLDRKKISPEDYLEYLTENLRGFDFAPIVFISAEKQEGLKELVAMAFNLFDQAGHRITTGQLNRIVEAIMNERGPSSRLGTQAKLYFANQVDIHPPTIVLKVNQPKLFEGTYERFLMNRLRDELPFSEVPFRLVFSTRERKDLEEMKAAGRRRSAK